MLLLTPRFLEKGLRMSSAREAQKYKYPKCAHHNEINKQARIMLYGMILRLCIKTGQPTDRSGFTKIYCCFLFERWAA
jgi:hypothetical protein